MRSRRLDDSGQGILEALIALAVLLVAVMAFAQLQGHDMQATRTNRLHTTRDRIIYSVPKIAGMKGAIRNSILPSSLASSPANSQLAGCIQGSAGVCDSSRFYDFQLFSPSVNASDDTAGPISGIPSAQMPYDFEGSPCAEAACPATQYPFLVSTRFRPLCPLPADGTFSTVLLAGITPLATCNQADEMEVEITISPAPGAVNPLPPYKISVFVENSGITGA